MGLGKDSSIVHIVDMGLAKEYYDPIHRQHLKYRDDKSLTGTARYASVHSHMGEQLSRRDDFEALCYLLIFFYTGSLPWQNIGNNCERVDVYYQIMMMKLKTTAEDLCLGCPSEFIHLLKYVRGL